MVLNMNNWLTEKLKLKVKAIFEPKYKRVLLDEEIVEIAESLVGTMEICTKYRWKLTYGD